MENEIENLDVRFFFAQTFIDYFGQKKHLGTFPDVEWYG